MLKTETRDIDGLQVTCTEFPCLQQYALLPRIGELGPLIERMAVGPFDEDSPLLLAASLSRLKPEAARALPVALLAGCKVGDAVLASEEAIARAFGGNLRASLKAVLFALEVNFGDFFADAGRSAPPAPASTTASPAASGPTSPPASASRSTRILRPRGRAGDSSAKDG